MAAKMAAGLPQTKAGTLEIQQNAAILCANIF
jgi:hypothetical protein